MLFWTLFLGISLNQVASQQTSSGGEFWTATRISPSTTRPEPRKGHTATRIKGRIFVFGGKGKPESNCCHELYTYTVESRSWEKKVYTNINTTPYVSGHSATLVDDDKIFFFGGMRYYGEDGTHKLGSKVRGAGSSWSNQLFILKGISETNEKLVMENATYADSSLQISGRQDHTAILIPGSKLTNGPSIFVFGGDSSEGYADNDLWRLETRPDKNGKYAWSKVVTNTVGKPPKRFGHASIFLSNRYFVIYGGIVENVPFGNSERNNVYVLDIQSKVKQWKVIKPQGPNAPQPGSSSKMFLWGSTIQKEEQILLFPGCHISPLNMNICSQDTFEIIVKENFIDWSWKKLQDNPSKTGTMDETRKEGSSFTHFHSTSSQGQHVFVFGGSKGNTYFNEMIDERLCTGTLKNCQGVDIVNTGCYPGWGGRSCEIPECPRNCTSPISGECVQKRMEENHATSLKILEKECLCKYGYKGCGDLGRSCGKNAICKTFGNEAAASWCECKSGWGGAYCNTKTCENECTSPQNGKCIFKDRKYQCKCNENYYGASCEKSKYCLNNCSENGKCEMGKCNCSPGWTSEDCSMLDECKNLNRCSGKGKCIAGSCVCIFGWKGTICSEEETCPSIAILSNGVCPGKDKSDCVPCSGNGLCIAGVCMCNPGFFGRACSKITLDCGPECLEHGKCLNGKCFCNPGYHGKSCTKNMPCPKRNPKKLIGNQTANSQNDPEAIECGGNGICKYGRCFCNPGYAGEDCQPQTCPIEKSTSLVCAGHGFCVNEKCFCEPGYHGVNCLTGSPCPKDCLENGYCLDGVCTCDVGWKGESCEKQVPCPNGKKFPKANGCSGHGHCLRGRCYCDPSFTGKACSETRETCGKQCSIHGTCDGTICRCDQGYEGKKCDRKITCVDNCKEHGKCLNGRCICYPGFTGKRCEERLPCPHDCRGRGDCKMGICNCDPGYSGVDCSTRDSFYNDCEEGCREHGYCVGSECICFPGWRGYWCDEEVTCKENCSGHGLCKFGSCFCDPGWDGDTCLKEKQCKFNCSGHGVCKFGQCFCLDGWKGDGCNRGEHLNRKQKIAQSCGEGCAKHGTCYAGQCDCKSNDEWYGKSCNVKVPIRGCLEHGCDKNGKCNIHTKKCTCNPNRAGADCSKLAANYLVEIQNKCTDTCQNGTCLKGRCECDYNWSGENCSKLKCQNSCGVNESRGKCIDGECVCEPAFAGKGCEIECPKKCSGNGTCKANTMLGGGIAAHCLCIPGFVGESCDINISDDPNEMMTTIPGISEYRMSTLNKTQENSIPAVSFRPNLDVVSIVIVALTIFIFGLIIVPTIKAVSENRERRRRIRILENKPSTFEELLKGS